MKDKKHIDELFKEQLQNYEAAPSPQVWTQIQAQLKKEKEDRKVIPLWWKLGGVAAVLALLLALNFVFEPFNTNTTPVLVVEDVAPIQVDENAKDEKTNSFKDANVLANEENTELLKEKETLEETDKEILSATGDKNSTTVATSSSKEKKKSQSQFNTEVVSNTKDAVTATETKNKTITKDKASTLSSEKNKNIDPLLKQDPSEGIAVNANTSVGKVSDKVKNEKNEVGAEVKNELKDTSKDPSVITSEENLKKEEVGIAITTENEKNKDPISKEEAAKKSIFDAIEEEKEEAIAKVDEKDLKSWEVTPNFGPVFYNSLSNGSSIDPTFADNSQNGDVNFSYGVQVSYAINERLSVRSGISNVDLGYTTGGVELATGPTALGLRTVDYGGKNVVLTAVDKGTLGNRPPPNGDGGGFGNLNPKSTGGNAEIIQNLSYYEVPMELKYALFNKRFGVNMIGGFSTLFLGDNEISVQDGNFRDVLGEANNLNSVSFTTNVGLGLDYKISKRLKFNIEPMFKYQLNPYTDSSVDFKPYYFGVYSGLSFRF